MHQSASLRNLYAKSFLFFFFSFSFFQLISEHVGHITAKRFGLDTGEHVERVNHKYVHQVIGGYICQVTSKHIDLVTSEHVGLVTGQQID